ncbi:MAG TPA: protease complex subunit PrcB family protein [Symbiobacteriaceae bacterium]|nr:protease complex subunit PrcB family protein [Symbiobacteriaceae bacterium]
MRLPRYPKAAALLLVATTALLTGCSAADLALTRKACAQNQAACRLVLKELENELDQTIGSLQVVKLSRDEAPGALVKWADSEAAHTSGGFAHHEGGFTFLAISGGERPTGGWQVNVDRVVQVDGGYRVEASLLPPAGPSIDAVTVATGFFRVQALSGAISFNVTGDVQTGGKPDEVQTLSLQAASSSQAPEALQTWIASQRGLPKPEGKTLTVGTETWIALAGGVRPTGGYRVEVQNTFQENGTWVIQARVVPPAPGSIVTQALTTPTAYYKTSAITGPVEIRWVDSQSSTQSPPSIKR